MSLFRATGARERRMEIVVDTSLHRPSVKNWSE